MSVTAPTVLPGNVLSKASCDFEDGTAGIWVAFANCSVASSTDFALSGTRSLRVTATAGGSASIISSPIPVSAVAGYVQSLYAYSAASGLDVYVTAYLKNSGFADLGNVAISAIPMTAGTWQPVTMALTTSYPTTKYVSLAVTFDGMLAAGKAYIDLAYLAKSGIQVLADWSNPAYQDGSSAGAAFCDLTPYARLDQGVSITRGRQDAISEIQTGQATLQLQNDTGWFTPKNSRSPFSVIGGTVGIGARVQINLTDEAGTFSTRFDGSITQIDYALDNTGNTNVANVTMSDVFAFLSRQGELECWTKETVLLAGPWMHWTLDDAGNAGATGNAAESSGNSGPLLHPISSTTSTSATIAWRNTNAGVEIMADAVTPNGYDGSHYWAPGAITPSADVNGYAYQPLNPGPYQTPLPSAYFTPVCTAQSAQNQFVGTEGYRLAANLPAPVDPNAVGTDYTLEAWFNTDPYIQAHAASNFGPFVVLSLGNSRNGSNLLLGVYLNAGTLEWVVGTYNQPPAQAVRAFGVSASAAVSDVIATATAADGASLRPRHFAVTITGDPAGATVEGYIDGLDMGSFTLPVGQRYDTVTIGSAHGGGGAFYGNVSLVSVYQYALPYSEILRHTKRGLYGAWETPTDYCVSALGLFSDVPKFWNGLTSQYFGLSLTDYFDISGSNPLTAMQVYEGAEHGLLYVAANGLLTFHTRDWRMGYNAPDVLLPPDVYDASMGYELIDQYIINTAAIATQTYQTGGAAINQASVNTYGLYASGTPKSPTQLPLITWSRAYGATGLQPWYYWPDPQLDDLAGWLVNTHSSPMLTCGQLTVDLLTLDSTSGLKISNFYALEIDSMVALTGSLPVSLPDQTGSLELFIEGITETFTLTKRSIQLFTSPADMQRAWKPGDATYGQLGHTSRIGISATDLNTPPSLGKSVSHDAGPPYWPPQFTAGQSLSVNDVFDSGDYTGWVGFQGALSASNTVTDGPEEWTLVVTSSGVSPAAAEYNGPSGYGFAATAGSLYSASAWVLYPAGGQVDIGFDWHNGAGTYLSTNVQTYTLGAGVWTQVTTTQTAAASTGYAVLRIGQHGAVLVGTALDIQQAQAMPGQIPVVGDMNNPADSDHGFIGALDIRGVKDTLQTALRPPLLVVGQSGHAQTFPTGANSSPTVVWDSIYIDTAGAMGAVPGWPNWYVCLLPGYYEIDADFVWNQPSPATSVRLMYITVAQKAAQAVAAGTGTPLNVNKYVCPIGEQHNAPNGSAQYTALNGGTRIYLGLGDMVNVSGEQATGGNWNSNPWAGGPMLSLRWAGYSTGNDQWMINQSISGTPPYLPPNPPGGKRTYTTWYWSTHTYSYWGRSSSRTPQLRTTDGHCNQGTWYADKPGGSQVSFALFNYTKIQGDLAGATLNWADCQMTNMDSWYDSGAWLQVGYTPKSTYTNALDLTGWHPNWKRQWFKKGQKLRFNLGLGIGGAFASGAARSLTFGDSWVSNNGYSGWWHGYTGVAIILNYTK